MSPIVDMRSRSSAYHTNGVQPNAVRELYERQRVDDGRPSAYKVANI